jgi:hypothetical protein
MRDSAADAVMVPNSLGPGELLMRFWDEGAAAILAASPCRWARNAMLWFDEPGGLLIDSEFIFDTARRADAHTARNALQESAARLAGAAAAPRICAYLTPRRSSTMLDM